MAGVWAPLRFKSSERLFARRFVNGSRMPGHDFVAKRFVARFRERRLGLARHAARARRAARRSAPRGRLRSACRSAPRTPAAFAALATAASSSRCERQAERHRVLRLDVRDVPVAALADRGDGRARGADQLADLPVGDFGMVRMIQAIPSGLSWRLRDRRVARALGAADLAPAPCASAAGNRDRSGRFSISSWVSSPARIGSRPVSLVAAVSSAIACTSRMCRPQNSAICSKVSERVVDQPGGGRMGHQGLGHWVLRMK